MLQVKVSCGFPIRFKYVVFQHLKERLFHAEEPLSLKSSTLYRTSLMVDEKETSSNPIEVAIGVGTGGGGGGGTMESMDVLDQDSNCIGNVSCTTFNILAPIYKRVNGVSCESESRESQFKEYWLNRNENILDILLRRKSSIICIQEFWVGSEELVGMYERRLSDAGYKTYKLARTNNRGDGLLIAVLRNDFQVWKYEELLFNDVGDRVAQLLHVELITNFTQNKTVKIEKEALIVNTHLMFPHDSSLCFIRLQQVYKLLQYIESYRKIHQLQHVPVILCGDWNGSKRGHVYKFLRSQGFVSSYDVAHHYTDEDAHKWVSHRNHRGNLCAVDFVWLYNPNNHRRPLKISFMKAVLGNVKNHRHDGNSINKSQFLEIFSQLGQSCGFNVLSTEEVKELWDQVDTDGDGVIEFSLLNAFSQQSNSIDNSEQRGTEGITSNIMTLGFKIKNAVFGPSEVEKGLWPENYSLSDHAHLTVEFSPMTMQFS